MPLDPEKSERLIRAIKYSLIAGIGAAGVHHIRKGDKLGYIRLTGDRLGFFAGVIQEGRNRINQISGNLPYIAESVSPDEVKPELDDEYTQPTDEDIAEIESVFIEQPGKVEG